ncbi:MAG: hypothetical protein ACM3TN_28785 [Alphaproteobacteria bacterium]
MVNKDILESAQKDPIGALFETDTLASERYQRLFRSSQIPPEKRLILAILDDAVQSFIATMRPRNPKELREFEAAQTWIMEANSDWIFSFESVCDQLGLDPDYLRGGLQKLKIEASHAPRTRQARAGRLPRARIALGRTTLRQTSRRVFSASETKTFSR